MASSFTVHFASVRNTVQSLATPLLRSARHRSVPILQNLLTRSKAHARKWALPIGIVIAAYEFGVAPETREDIRMRAVGTLDPLLEWRFDRVHGKRKRTLLAHYGVSKGGTVLELFPGAGSSFLALDSLSKPDARAYPLFWKGLDMSDVHWRSGRIQEAAGTHAGIPQAQMEFQTAGKDRTLLQMLKEIPEASMQHVLALHGLSSVFTSRSSHARHALSSSSSSSSSSAQQQAELQSILKEVYRVLKPGGRFIFLDEGAYPSDSFSRTEQDLLSSLTLKQLHPAGHTAPLEIAQTLPAAGFAEAHVEQWPSYLDPSNSRKGIRVLRVLEVDGKVVLDGMQGTAPLVAGVATKSANATQSRVDPMAMLHAEQGNLGSMFRGY